MIKIKEFRYALCLLFFVLLLTGCAGANKYTNQISGFSFNVYKNQKVDEDENGDVIVMLSDKVTVAVTSGDASAYADEEYLFELSKKELNLRSGAFESTYNNTLFVSKLMDYLFADSEHAYTVYGVREATFNTYDAWIANVLSKEDDVNATVYICVENGRSYFICIYIKDQNNNRHDYDKIINEFIKSFQIEEIQEVE